MFPLQRSEILFEIVPSFPLERAQVNLQNGVIIIMKWQSLLVRQQEVCPAIVYGRLYESQDELIYLIYKARPSIYAV